MSASTGRSGDKSIRARELLLGDVSKAAAALARTSMPNQFIGTPNDSKLTVAPSALAKPGLSVLPQNSLDGGLYPSRRYRSSTRLFCVLFAIGVPATILGTQFDLSDIWREAAIYRWTQPDLTPDVSASVPITRETPPSPRLIIEPSRGPWREPLRLGLAVHGSAEGAIVYMAGVLPGIDFSAGNAIGPNGWQIAASDLEHTWIAPPADFVGTINIVAELRFPDNRIADRQVITFEWVAPVDGSDKQLDRKNIGVLHSILAQLVQRFVPAETSSADLLTRSDVPKGTAEVPPEPIAQESDQASELTTLLDRPQLRADDEDYSSRQKRAGVFAADVSTRSQLAQLQTDHAEPHSFDAPSSSLRQPERQRGAAMPPGSTQPEQHRTDVAEAARSNSGVSPATRLVDPAEIALLLKRGKDLIASGDLAAARVVLHRAADLNDAEAALALGATYDPYVLRELKVYGLAADPVMARTWYEKAKELGSAAASRRLELLSR